MSSWVEGPFWGTKFSLLASKKVRYALAKSSCVLCFCRDNNSDDHGVHQADMTQALARWRHLGASHEAIKMLHRSMCFAPYCPGGMVVGFAVKIATFFYIIDNRVATNKLISLLFYQINWIALTEPSTIPSSMSGLRWIGSNYKIRAAGGSGNSPWCGC